MTGDLVGAAAQVGVGGGVCRDPMQPTEEKKLKERAKSDNEKKVGTRNGKKVLLSEPPGEISTQTALVVKNMQSPTVYQSTGPVRVKQPALWMLCRNLPPGPEAQAHTALGGICARQWGR